MPPLVHVPTEPHTAVVTLRVQVFQKLPTGDLTGMVVEDKQVILGLHAQDHPLCVRRSNELIEEVKRLCK
jgi:hypothetical protein